MRTLLISALLDGYRSGRATPAEVMRDVLASIEAAPERNVWISRLPAEKVMAYARALEQRPTSLPLYGVPFAIKDNIDLAGVPTTAACPEYSYVPAESAPVVQKLIDAGAIPIGKTNLDQFATGLVGTRSPYGACMSSIDPEFISGGSSSGSAVAVASGLVSFALGTDTAGSGRVPAAFNNIVGLKPSCGMLSTRGVVPACRSLDCVSIFALTADDAQSVLEVARGFDELDPWSRDFSHATSRSDRGAPRVAIPAAEHLNFFDDQEYAALFAQTKAAIEELGWTCVEIDFQPFLDAARLLYEGPWVAERYVAIADLLERQPESIHAVTRKIIGAGAELKAADAFRAQYRLKELQRSAERLWREFDVLMTPTAGTVYRIDDVMCDPFKLNSNLGYYTNFVNLMDLAAVAVPAGFRRDGMPFGVTLVGKAGDDTRLLDLADQLHRARVNRLGALDRNFPPARKRDRSREDLVQVVVCGAHMEGLPLNHQLLEREGVLVARTRTAPRYRLFALPGGPPYRPGLMRVNEGGCAIEVETWSLPMKHFGSFVAGIPAPLGIGKVELEDGSWRSGFLCEPLGLEGATDISALGGWRAYLRSI